MASCRSKPCHHRGVKNEQFVTRRTPESQALLGRVPVVMELTSRLNLLPFSDLDGRNALLAEIFGRELPEDITIYPPFYCDYGLNLEFGGKVFVNQNCSFYDLGGISIGGDTMIGPGVTLSTSGHPVDPAQRYDGITLAPIVIESNVWIGANATITPGVTIGQGSVVGAGAVISQDVPPCSLVTSSSHITRKQFTHPTTAN